MRNYAKHPVAVARVSETVANALRAERRVGKLVARAASEVAFSDFEAAVLDQACSALTSPNRLLTIPHLTASISKRMGELPAPSSVLIDGYVYHFMSTGKIGRLNTISRAMKPYQALFWHTLHGAIVRTLERLASLLAECGSLTASEAKEVAPRELLVTDQHIEVLFGHLLYLGLASTDVAPTQRIDSVRLPYAPSKL